MLQKIKSGTDGCFSQEELDIIKTHLHSVISSIEAHKHYSMVRSVQTFEQKSNPPPNSYNKKQPRFFLHDEKPNPMLE